LHTTVESPVFSSSREGGSVPTLDAVASRSADGKMIYVKVVNTGRALEVKFEITGTSVATAGEQEVLAASRPNSHNSFATPNAITPKSGRFTAGRTFTLSVPAQSVSVLTLPITR
jgi:alpha-L-arabinofuranosidase